MKSMASSSSSTAKHPHFTTIEEGNEEDEISQGKSSSKATPVENGNIVRKSNSYSDKSKSKENSKKRSGNTARSGVSCNKCGLRNKEKTSVNPLETNGLHKVSMAGSNGICKSIFASAPQSKTSKSEGEEHWKTLASDLTDKLILATRKRDEAIREVSKLKHSSVELEKKLNKLEIHCHSLKSGFDNCSTNGNTSFNLNYQRIRVGDQDMVIGNFIDSVSEARSTIRILSRALAVQLKQMGTTVCNQITSLLQPYDIKVSFSKNSRSLLYYMEALLNRAFFEDFESIGFQKNAPKLILNPIDQCEANIARFNELQGLTWKEVLHKGTKHHSEDFSKFCDRKMSGIVAMFGWNRAWPEPLLQAFFGASKAVWLVHLLANTVHPCLPIFRVDKGVEFDAIYMEDIYGDKAKMLTPAVVRIMVTPGFYVFDNVIKCKVLCRYYNNNSSNYTDKGGPASSSPQDL